MKRGKNVLPSSKLRAKTQRKLTEHEQQSGCWSDIHRATESHTVSPTGSDCLKLHIHYGSELHN